MFDTTFYELSLFQCQFTLKNININQQKVKISMNLHKKRTINEKHKKIIRSVFISDQTKTNEKTEQWLVINKRFFIAQ